MFAAVVYCTKKEKVNRKLCRFEADSCGVKG